MPVALARRKKPLGVFWISLYGTLVGILHVMEGLFSMRSYVLDPSPSGIAYLGPFSVFFGVLFLFNAIGIWAIQGWAHPLTRIVYAMAMGWILITLISKGFSGEEIVLRAIEFSVMMAILAYLKKPEIKVLYRTR